MSPARVAGGDVSRVMVGGEPLSRIVCAGVDVWKSRYSFADNFDRSNQNLGDSPDWVDLGTTSDVRMVIEATATLPSTTNKDGTYGRFARHVNPANTDVSRVAGTSASSTLKSDTAFLFFCSSDDFPRNGVFLCATTSTSERGLWTSIDGSQTRRVAITLPSAIGTRYELISSRNSSGVYTYEVLVNGTPSGSWTDSGGVVRRGEGYRYAGVGGTMRRAFFANNRSNGWDDFELSDV